MKPNPFIFGIKAAQEDSVRELNAILNRRIRQSWVPGYYSRPVYSIREDPFVVNLPKGDWSGEQLNKLRELLRESRRDLANVRTKFPFNIWVNVPPNRFLKEPLSGFEDEGRVWVWESEIGPWAENLASVDPKKKHVLVSVSEFPDLLGTVSHELGHLVLPGWMMNEYFKRGGKFGIRNALLKQRPDPNSARLLQIPNLGHERVLLADLIASRVGLYWLKKLLDAGRISPDTYRNAFNLALSHYSTYLMNHYNRDPREALRIAVQWVRPATEAEVQNYIRANKLLRSSGGAVPFVGISDNEQKLREDVSIPREVLDRIFGMLRNEEMINRRWQRRRNN